MTDPSAKRTTATSGRRIRALASRRLGAGAVLIFAAGCGLIWPPPVDPVDEQAETPTTGVDESPVAFRFEEDADPRVAALPFVENELLARILPGATPEDLQEAYVRVGAVLLEEIAEIQMAALQVDPGSLGAVAAALSADPLFESVHKNYLYQVQEVPSDPRYSSQRHLAAIGLREAWDITTGDEDMIIAICDTGVEPNHPDLEGKLLPGWNVHDNSGDSSDVHGHGTAVAGTAAAMSDNRLGVAGVCWDNPILPIRVSDERGRAASRKVAAGIIWAVNHGARVINVSFAPLASDVTVRSAAEYARNSGSLVFISSGNDGKAFRARDRDATIFVGAVEPSGQLASFSNTGPYIDLVAPGRDIFTTEIGRGYDEISGTSFSSPIVAGVAALVWSVNPGFRPATVEGILFDTARDRGPRGRDDSYGFGIVDAAAAVEAALDTVEEEDTRAPEVEVISPDDREVVSGSIRASVGVFDAVGVADVVLSIDGVPFATDASSPYRFVVNTRSLEAGMHTLTFVATDTSGNSSDPVRVRIEVEGSRNSGSGGGSGSGGSDRVDPVIVINLPVDGTRVSGRVGIQATVTDNVGLRSIELLVDGERLEQSRISGTRRVVTFVWDASRASAGLHTVTIRVEDRARNRATALLTLVKESR